MERERDVQNGEMGERKMESQSLLKKEEEK
jgi:hypothetical protein